MAYRFSACLAMISALVASLSFWMLPVALGYTRAARPSGRARGTRGAPGVYWAMAARAQANTTRRLSRKRMLGGSAGISGWKVWCGKNGSRQEGRICHSNSMVSGNRAGGDLRDGTKKGRPQRAKLTPHFWYGQQLRIWWREDCNTGWLGKAETFGR